MKLAFRLARNSLRTHRFRSFLTEIGIVIGVVVISFTLIISDSLSSSIRQQAASLGANTVLINGSDSGNSTINSQQLQPTMSNKDLDNFKRSGAFDHLIASLLLKSKISSDSNSVNTASILATSSDFQSLLNLKLKSGSWFDSGATKKWAVLGSNLANNLLGTTEAQNQVINIKGQNFTVVGILDKVNQPLSIIGYNIDDTAFISLDNGQSLDKSEALSQIIIYRNKHAIDKEYTDIITQLMNREHGSNDYIVNTSSQLQTSLNHLLSSVKIITIVLSGIVLFISGIGIMNMMLVNVIERQHEIGIRKAVGATNYDILKQFIAEALIMGLRGGIVGIVLAYLLAFIALVLLSIPLIFSLSSIIVGFAIPIIIAVFFGAYPAYRAAKQDIIDALRQLT